MMESGDRYLKLAQECVREAERTIDPLQQEFWLKMAEERVALARVFKERCH